jgi:hypothetical protein
LELPVLNDTAVANTTTCNVKADSSISTTIVSEREQPRRFRGKRRKALPYSERQKARARRRTRAVRRKEEKAAGLLTSDGATQHLCLADSDVDISSECTESDTRPKNNREPLPKGNSVEGLMTSLR